jgi:hypothetical protein
LAIQRDVVRAVQIPLVDPLARDERVDAWCAGSLSLAGPPENLTRRTKASAARGCATGSGRLSGAAAAGRAILKSPAALTADFILVLHRLWRTFSA